MLKYLSINLLCLSTRNFNIIVGGSVRQSGGEAQATNIDRAFLFSCSPPFCDFWKVVSFVRHMDFESNGLCGAINVTNVSLVVE